MSQSQGSNPTAEPRFPRFHGAQNRIAWRWFRRLAGLFVWLKRGRVEVHGEDNIPHGPVVLAYSHHSIWDAIIMMRAMKHRGMRLVGKEKLFFFRFFVTRFIAVQIFGIVPVPLGRANNGSRQMKPRFRKWLEERVFHPTDGGPIAIAIGGGITHQLVAVEKYSYGVARWALGRKVPVVLVGIGGAEKYKSDGRVINRRSEVLHVVFSEPVDPNEWLMAQGFAKVPDDEESRRELYGQFTHDILCPVIEEVWLLAESLAESTRRYSI